MWRGIKILCAKQNSIRYSPQWQQLTGNRCGIIYFSFNSIWIEPSERAKVKQIADMMKTDKSIRILVTGWSDGIGGKEANKRVSLLRAEAVKRVLGQWFIPAGRIETAGGSINRTVANETEARIATIIDKASSKSWHSFSRNVYSDTYCSSSSLP